MTRVRAWLLNAVLLPLDYLLSGLLWQMPGMTVSSRCGLALIAHETGWRGTLKRGIGLALNCIDEDHCFNAILGDLKRIEKTHDRLAPAADVIQYFRM